MKTTFYKSLILGLSFLSCLTLSAQYNKTSYFMKGSTTKQLMNPALNSGRAYLDLPILGGIDLGTSSNMGVTTFFFPDEENDQLLTFLHPDVSADQFLDGLADNNFLEMNSRFALFGFGANTKHGYLSFNMDFKVDGGMNIPKSFFAFLKKGMDNGTRTTYDIRDLKFYGEGYLETGIGYSIDLLDNLSVGLRLKGLLGASTLNGGIDQMLVDMTPEEWTFTTKASLSTNAPVNFTYSESGPNGYVNGGNPALGKIKDAISAGYGIDFGVAYSPIKDLVLSAAVTDLGGIKWNNMLVLKSAGEVKYAGINNLNIGDDNSNTNQETEEQLEELVDDMKEIIQFREDGTLPSEFHRLTASTVIGAEYSAWKNRVSAGLLYTTDYNRFDNYSEMMFVANIRSGTAVGQPHLLLRVCQRSGCIARPVQHPVYRLGKNPAERHPRLHAHRSSDDQHPRWVAHSVERQQEDETQCHQRPLCRSLPGSCRGHGKSRGQRRGAQCRG